MIKLLVSMLVLLCGIATAAPAEPQRIVEYFYRLPDGNYLYISGEQPGGTAGYGSFKLFIGTGETMKRVPITHVVRYRDGGTTEVTTTEGDLYAPTPLRPERTHTWKGKKIEPLKPEEFVIEETERGVRIRKGSAREKSKAQP